LVFGVLPYLMAGCFSSPPRSAVALQATERASLRAKGEDQLRLQKAESEPKAEAPPPDVPSPPDGAFAVRVRAKVNGTAILDNELKNATYPALMAIRDLPEPEKSAQQKAILQRALEQLIEREVILAEAFGKLKGPNGQKALEKIKASADREFDKQVRDMKRRAHCGSDEEFKQLLALQGQSLDDMRRQFQRTMIASEYMRFRVSSRIDRIGLAEVREYYDQHPGEFRVDDSVRWQDIFIAADKHGGQEGARHFAQGILARAKGGEDFAQLAKKYDEGPSSLGNGEGFGQRRGEIRPAEAEPVLFDLHDGEVGPLVELDTGVHLVRLIKREHAGLMPFDAKTQNFILKKLKNEVGEREWKRILKELREKAIVEVCP
jgi:parvulin-like peptidyl-prolyl isomerase